MSPSLFVGTAIAFLACMEIHQLLPLLNYGDAIGNHAMGIQQTLRRWGHSSEIFAEGCHEKVEHLYHHYSEHSATASPDSLLIYHHCIGGTEAFEYFRAARCRKTLIYHNITPSHYFADFHPELHQQTKTGRRELLMLRDVVQKAIGVSEYNCQELRDVGFVDPLVLPISIDVEAFGARTADENLLQFFDDGYTNILFVGRLCPNKRQDLLIRAFDRYRRTKNAKSRLFLVGSYQGMERYCNHLLDAMRQIEACNIIISGHVNNAELATYYRLADVFVCLSEHEGFCVPLLESMYCDVPIVAYDSSGVTSTLGGASVLLESHDEQTVVDAIDRMVTHGALRAEIVKQQRARLADFAPQVIEPVLQRCLKEIVAYA